MNNKAIGTVWIVLIGVLILGGAVVGYLVLKGDIPGIVTEDGFIKVRFYDANGDPITPSLSIVNGVSGVSFIDLTITANNDGSIPLTCNILSGSVTPSTFALALPTSQKSLPVNGKAEWTSNLIAVASFETLPQPTLFSATIRCSTGTSNLDNSGEISLNILQDGTGSFNVNINPGGIPTQYCGDGTCQSTETATNCPADCGVSQKAKYRTSDRLYSVGSAIAYTNTCGNVLTAYGYDTSSCWTVTDATCPVKAGYNLTLSNIPGNPLWGSNVSRCLYKNTADSTRMTVAWKTTSTSGPCSTVGQWGAINYWSGDSDKTKVSTSYVSFNQDKEVIC